MKTAKKLLCLMIVLVMAFGMVPFVSAGPADMNVDDYADFDSIQYKEAVDVLTALGVLQGDGDDGARAFRPGDTITRAEASKIIAYILLGTRAADSLVPVSTGFRDVPASHWASPFVGYCVQMGIINGYGTGLFGPSDPVTAIQMAKMLLTSVGYGTQGEYVGPGWELRVLDKAMARGISILARTGNVDYSAAATREEVAQYTFNALTVPNMVTWNSILNDYSSWSNVFMNTGDQLPTLGDKTFYLGFDEVPDAYGFNVWFWKLTNINRRITIGYEHNTLLGTSTNGTPLARLGGGGPALTQTNVAGYVASFGSATNGGASYTPWTVPMFVNGVEIDAIDPTTATVTSLTPRAQALALASISGVTVNLISIRPWNTGRIDRVVIVAKSVQEASGAPIVSSGTGNVTIPGTHNAGLMYDGTAGPGNNAPMNFSENALFYDGTAATGIGRAVSSVAPHLVEYPSDIVRGDILLVHTKVVARQTVIVVEKAESETGRMTASLNNTVAQNMTFEGTRYSESGLTPGVMFAPSGTKVSAFVGMTPFTTSNSNYNRDATIWLDDNGGVVYYRLDAEAASVYGLILGYVTTGSVSLRLAAEVRLLTADGSVGVYSVAIDPATGVVPDQTAVFRPGGTFVPTIVTYEINANNEVTVSPVGINASVAHNNAAFASVFTTDNTRYLARTTRIGLVNTDGPTLFNITGSTKVFYYDGLGWHPINHPATVGTGSAAANQNMPNGANNVYYVPSAPGSTNLAAIWFTVMPGAGAVRYAFVSDARYSTIYDSDLRATVYTYDEVYIGGEKIAAGSFKLGTNTAITGAGLWSYQIDPVTGLAVNLTQVNQLVSAVIPPSGTNANVITQSSSGGVVYGTGHTVVPTDSNTKFYRFVNDPTGPYLVELTSALVVTDPPAGLHYKFIAAELAANTTAADPDPRVAVYFMEVPTVTFTGISAGTTADPWSSTNATIIAAAIATNNMTNIAGAIAGASAQEMTLHYSDGNDREDLATLFDMSAAYSLNGRAVLGTDSTAVFASGDVIVITLSYEQSTTGITRTLALAPITVP